MRALEFITGHVIFKLCYNQIYQLKTNIEFTFVCLYQSMPTIDDDFWTLFLVGITSLNSILVASSFKFLLSRPVLPDVSEL